ncbi:hypothetical protein NIES2111_58770 (plasmid) [Nostoc sp. NIES-2111]|nr:hypothetical protein NIES2111_58770 [Nostoc sp. NIES-2111]
MSEQEDLDKVTNSELPNSQFAGSLINSESMSARRKRRQFLQWIAWGGVGVITTVVAHQFTQNHTKQNSTQNNEFSSDALKSFNFKIVRVNAQGKITNTSQHQAQYFAEDLGNGVTLEMVAIPSGSFFMGSPATKQEQDSSEEPLHQVNIPSFFMGKYEVTQAQYQAIMGSNPSHFKGKSRPVEQVSWNDAIEFCKRLSQKTGRSYRLPSEAEWEYACRAGTSTPFYFGETITGDLVNYNATAIYASESTGQFRGQTIPVGQFPPNTFGLYDMHGNVWEWCQDTWNHNYNGAPIDGSAWVNAYHAQNRLLRGGSWVDFAEVCRCPYRASLNPDGSFFYIGFRVVCDGSTARTF